MYVSVASGRGKCGTCGKPIIKGEKQLVVDKSVNGYNTTIRYCNADATTELEGLLKDLKGEKHV